MPYLINIHMRILDRTAIMRPADDHSEPDGPSVRSSADRRPSVDDALSRLIGGDPLAADILQSAARAHPGRFELHAALAIVCGDAVVALSRARELAVTRFSRQHVAIIAEHLTGDATRTRLLARQHLAEFPDDVVISWLVKHC